MSAPDNTQSDGLPEDRCLLANTRLNNVHASIKDLVAMAEQYSHEILQLNAHVTALKTSVAQMPSGAEGRVNALRNAESAQVFLQESLENLDEALSMLYRHAAIEPPALQKPDKETG